MADRRSGQDPAIRIIQMDLKRHGNGSTVNVKRCMQIADQKIACELFAQLKWIDGETQIEAVFQRQDGYWTMIAAKNR